MKAIILAGLLMPALALAQVPSAISFQGRLLKSDGTPEAGSPSITFRIYDAGAGGNQLWSETQTVKLTNGFYAVQLGSQTAFTSDVFNGSARWLGVTVAGDSEMAPRQYIATVPYAFKAARADSATSATSATNASRASSADNVAWTGVSGTPTQFPPAAHSHAGSDITSAVSQATNASRASSADSVAWTGVSGRPSQFPPAAHSHAGSDITSAVSQATSATRADYATTADGLTAKGIASLPGLVVGGYVSLAQCGCTGCTYSCSGAWGDGSCSTSAGSCNSGTPRPAGSSMLCVK